MFADLLGSHARRTGESVALRIKRGDTYEQWTYADVWEQARSAAAFLLGLKVASNERVGLFAENCPEWVLAYLGIHLAGAVVVPTDIQYTPHELQTILDFAHCRVMLCSDATLDTVLSLPSHVCPEKIVSIVSGSEVFGAAPLAKPVVRQGNDLMTVIFTSGTTADPKGVCLSLGNLASNIQAILSLGLVDSSDTVLSILPLHHTYALITSILTPLAAGASVTFCTSLRGPDIVRAMVETGVSVVPGIPKLFEAFDRAISDKLQQTGWWAQKAVSVLTCLLRAVRHRTGWNPGRLLFPYVSSSFGPRFRFFVSGGAKLDPDVTERMLDLGIRVVEGYGLTETSPVVTFNPIDRIRPGSVGVPIPGVEVEIADPDSDGVGEVLVRGPNVMQGYYRRPEETAKAITNGWFHTGDLGYVDKDGYLHLTGRAKDVIVLASGKNIYPEDVERVYEASPLVKDICVMPVEKADGRVERLRAVVVPDFDELRRLKATSVHEALHLEITRISQDIPSYMRVTELKLVTNELPRTRLGKLRRNKIQRMSLEGLEKPIPLLSREDQALLRSPGAERLLARLREMSRVDREIIPGDNLELDLGLDSLARVELEVALEQEFGIAFSPEELPNVNTVRDILSHLSGEQPMGRARTDWAVILQQPPSPPLAEICHISGYKAERLVIRAVRLLVCGLARRAFSLDIQGLDRLPATGPYLLCPTHASRIDAVLLFLCLPTDHVEKMCFLGAEAYFVSPIMRWVARAARVITSATVDTILVSLRRTAEAISIEQSVCIFAEGAVTRDGWLQRPRPGAGILACELSVPIVPVLMRGTYDTFSYTHPGFHFCPLGITFGAPIVPPNKQEYDYADYLEVMKAWDQSVVKMRMQDDASGSPTAGRSPRIHEKEPGDNS